MLLKRNLDKKEPFELKTLELKERKLELKIFLNAEGQMREMGLSVYRSAHMVHVLLLIDTIFSLESLISIFRPGSPETTVTTEDENEDDAATSCSLLHNSYRWGLISKMTGRRVILPFLI